MFPGLSFKVCEDKEQDDHCEIVYFVSIIGPLSVRVKMALLDVKPLCLKEFIVSVG